MLEAQLDMNKYFIYIYIYIYIYIAVAVQSWFWVRVELMAWTQSVRANTMCIRSFCYASKDERLSRPWSYPVILNMGPLNWESSTLTTRPLPHDPHDYLKKTSIKINVVTDKGNSQNEIGYWANNEIEVAVQSWLWVRIELMAC